MVTNEVRINPKGFVSVPCKYIHIFSKKPDQLFLFLKRQLSFYLEEPFQIITNNHIF